MTREDAKREMMFAKRNVVADSWIDQAYDLAIQALSQPEPHWIPIKWHDCTDKDREEYGYSDDVVVVLDCEMPNDNQEILVTTSHGDVEKDVCYIDDGFSLDSGYDWIDDIKAWMPLPKCYEGDTNVNH